jgi:succinate-semialdehyde dehydrogenase/glutarate-semialdehyde dehydrogenase
LGWKGGGDLMSILDVDHSSILKGVPTGIYIGGEWREASDNDRFDVIDPATGLPIASVANGTVSDAMDAVSAATVGSEPWAAAAPRERSEVLRRAYELMIEQAEDIAHLISLESGKALVDARKETLYAADFFRWFAEEAVRNYGELLTAPGGANQIMVVKQPIGVALLITPWNFPAAMLTRKIGPALAAGCTVVCKPAPETPLTALRLASLLQDAGVPNGVVNVIPSLQASEISARLLADPRVRKLSFTGSTEVGQKLLALAAEGVVDCSMELGGNGPFIVFDDADLDSAIAGAMTAKMRNGGEACTAANRFYVHSSVVDAFSQRLAEQMCGLEVGPGLSDTTELGPLVSASAQEKVAFLVESAVNGGAEVRTGGIKPEGPGYFYPPTVLSNVPADSPILDTEIFGPVAPIVTFWSEAEVIRLANNSSLGLASYIYTKDLARGLRVSCALEVGMIGINQGAVSDPAAPFGGVKRSGIGREGGGVGMAEFQESKYIACEWGAS